MANFKLVQPLWIAMLLHLLSNSASATPPEEIQALRSVGESLGIIGTNLWNYSLDPCSNRGSWTGIGCSSESIINSTITQVELSGKMLRGVLSGSICNLTFLTDLDLSQNSLRGQIPECIGTRLKHLKELYLDHNQLTGSIPYSLGGMTSLQVLHLGHNNLIGSIPSSIGGMTSLQTLYLRYNQLTGSIPSSLGDMRSLQKLYLNDNNLIGMIPASLGGMVSLQYLHIDNNQLEGEIPMELGNLINLVTLFLQGNRLSGTLAPVASLTNLKYLIGSNNRFSGEISIFEKLLSLEKLDLHLNNLTGSVPGFDNSFSNLRILDLSFNQLSGFIPESLNELPALEYLSFGHNNLTGNLLYTSQSLKSLHILDVSHNSLSGPLPAFPSYLSVDFSFNSFSLGTSAQPGDYFNCVSTSMKNRTALCGHEVDKRKLHSNFAVRAGNSGGEITNREGITFLKDSNSNKTGSYYLDSNENWYVEVSGQHSGTIEASWPPTVPAEYQDDSPALYETMRWSSSYLAYHGTNLEDGSYNVTLYFCDTRYPNSTFGSFDVILQGETIAQKLDVLKQAGANTAYKIRRNSTVINGRLSIEFIHTGSHMYNDTRGVIVSAILVKSYNYVIPSSSTLNRRKVVLATAATCVFVLLITISMFFIIRKWRNSKRKTFLSFELKAFTYMELFNATDGFSSTNKLGEGGFGTVYKGQLDDKRVAIKKLLHQTQQARDSLKQEIAILNSIQHKNLVVIRGYCLEANQSLLVFDYMERGSLEGFLHGSSGFLSWKQRHSIAVDTALGLAYLHDESRHRIIHCDMKPPNILLTNDLQPIITDFGMARLYEDGKSHVTITRMGGTIGYLAPEYVMHYQLSDKADVYSFGVVLLELISGRRALDSFKPSDEVLLVAYAHKLANQSPLKLSKLLDKRLEFEISAHQEVMDAGIIAVHCTLENPSLRPKMRDVWLMLKGTLDIPPIPLIADHNSSMVRALLSTYKAPVDVENAPS